MDRDKIKLDKTYTYATPSSTGKFKTTEIYQDGNDSWWVLGFDKTKNKDIKVRPGQVFASTR